MPATLIIKLPVALEKLNPVIHQKLDKFVVQQKDKVNIQCLSDTNLTEAEFHHNWSSNASRIVGEVIYDFCLLFPEFTNQSKKKKPTFKRNLNMTTKVTIDLPCSYYFLTETESKQLDAFIIKYKGIFDITYSTDESIKHAVMTYNSKLAGNKEFIDMHNDFYKTFPQFKHRVPTMAQRHSDLFNDPTNNQLAQDMQDKALASEREAQERALLKKHSIEKEITYISKDGLFSSNNLDDLIEKMNQDKEYQKLLNEVNAHLETVKGDTDIRDVIEYVVANYKLERKS